MTSRSLFIFIGVILLGCIPPIISGSRLGRAINQEAIAQNSLNDLTRNAKSILNLRSQRQSIALHKRPPNEVIPLINALLNDANLPTTRLSNLSSRSSGNYSPSDQNNSTLHHQSMTLILSHMTITDLGGFLGAWHAADHLWTITRLDLIHQNNPRGPQNLFAVTLQLDALYAEES